MRQIAFFTTDWNYELVGETLRGVSAFLEEHPDVDVRVFDCFSIDEEGIRDSSVYEIYGLADLEQYDGAIVQTHQIVLREAADRVERLLRKRGIPAVTIGTPLGDLPLIKSDDYGAFYRLTKHLIQEHGARKLWFRKGPEKYDESDQTEAKQRRFGFRDACRDLGIPEENVRYVDGNWKAYTGERAARIILDSEEKPDALVCANDDMALGAVSILREGGLRVPEDIMITGFDGIFSASLCTPRLATIDRNFQDVGYRAMETVIGMIEGRMPPPVVFNQMRDVLEGTCGCHGDPEAEVIRIKDKFYHQTRFLRHFYLTQDKIAGRLFSAESLQDVMEAIEQYYSIFGDGHVRIYLDERYYQSMRGGLSPEEEQAMAEGGYSGAFVMTGDSRKRVARSTEYSVVATGRTQKRIREGLSAEDRLIQYYPMSFGRIMVGVLMLRGVCAAAEMNLHESIINEIVLALETIRQHQQLNRLNAKLSDLYVTDQLTGLYNRFGVAKYGQPLFERLTAAGENVTFIFLDIDDMKDINDRYGHEAGDEALRMTAEVLRGSSRPGDYLMRYGGDEFIVIGQEWEEAPEKRVQQELDRVCEERSLPFRLGLSLGCYTRTPESGENLETCLQAADLKMYEAKKLRKQGQQKP